MNSMISLKYGRILQSKSLTSILFNKCEQLSTAFGRLEQAKSNDQASQNLLFPENDKTNERADNISKAMLYYLEKLNERDELMKVKTEEFEIGKRHLAKMMGENPEEFNQADIDRAISYLLPSGLFDKKARPFLKNPEEYYPKSKVAKFNKDGRPISHLFYTGQSELYQLTYEATQKLINLKKLEDALYLIKDKMGRTESNASKTRIDLTGKVWITSSSLASKLDRKINENDFDKFLTLLKKLAEHPLSNRERPFLDQYLTPFVPPIKMSDITEPQLNEDGRRFLNITTHLRNSVTDIHLVEGSGKFEIHSPTEGNFGIDYFREMIHRQQILYPFKVVDRVNKFDVKVKVNEGGMSCLAKSIRIGISKALCSFVTTDNIEKLRLAGLLTADTRSKERKKYGKEGARRAYTWKKR